VRRGPGGKEVGGGHIVVNAPDLAVASAIARRCPGLDLGSTLVEVRPVEPLPPL
jgi:hypothetical protein